MIKIKIEKSQKNLKNKLFFHSAFCWKQKYYESESYVCRTYKNSIKYD